MVQRTPTGGGLEPERRIARSRRRLRPFVRLVGWLTIAASGAVACSTGDPAEPVSGAEPLPTPTYHRDVAPILARSCIKCHHEGGVGPFALTDYEAARTMAPAMMVEVASRRMPPWGAHDTSECRPPLPWRDDERLSDRDIDTLRRWELAGAPEGGPSESPVVVAPVQRLDLSAPAIELVPTSAFQPAALETDEFRCFVLDSPVGEQGGYVSAIHVVPGNRQVVHHVTVLSDVGGIVSKRAGPDGSFDCSSSAPDGAVWKEVGGERPQLGWLLAWAPGGKPLELPQIGRAHV